MNDTTHFSNMRSAFVGLSLLTVVFMITAFFFVTISGNATGQVASILSIGEDFTSLGMKALLPLGLLFMWKVFG